MRKHDLRLVITFGITVLGVILVGQVNSAIGYWVIGIACGINLPGIIGLDTEES